MQIFKNIKTNLANEIYYKKVRKYRTLLIHRIKRFMIIKNLVYVLFWIM